MSGINKSALTALALAALVPFASACSSMSRTQKGAVIGAAGGGAVGAAVGKATGSTARGAIIGAAVGGAAGAIIGRQMDKQAEELAGDLEGADVTRIGEGIVVTFESGLLFDFDKAQLRSASRADLADFSTSLQKYPNTEVLIVGHTDAVGSDTYNRDLSERRAQAAKSYLVSQGIPASRIRIEGRGESEPVASNDSEVGRQQNRRVEVAIFASEEYRQELQNRNN